MARNSSLSQALTRRLVYRTRYAIAARLPAQMPADGPLMVRRVTVAVRPPRQPGPGGTDGQRGLDFLAKVIVRVAGGQERDLVDDDHHQRVLNSGSVVSRRLTERPAGPTGVRSAGREGSRPNNSPAGRGTRPGRADP